MLFLLGVNLSQNNSNNEEPFSYTKANRFLFLY